MAYQSSHTGPEVDAAVEMLSQIQDARDATAEDRAEVQVDAQEVHANAVQVDAQTERVNNQAATVQTLATEVEQAHFDTVTVAATAVQARDIAVSSASAAQASQTSATASEQAATAAAQQAADAADIVSALAPQVSDDADSAQQSATSAAASAASAAAVVTGGTATLTPAAGKIPLADGNGKIADGWLGTGIARSDAVAAATQAAALATTRTAPFLNPAASNPSTRFDGSPLRVGDRYFNTTAQGEYLYTSAGWVLNDATAAVAALESQISYESLSSGIPRANEEGKIDTAYLAPSAFAILPYSISSPEQKPTLDGSEFFPLLSGDNVNKATVSALRGYVIPKKTTGNSIVPTLVRSTGPSQGGIYDGSYETPSIEDKPATWFQKIVNYDSGSDRYRQTPGAALFEVVALGSGTTNSQNNGSWAGTMANARLKNKNVGSATAPVSDGFGSLTGMVGFAKADFFPGNGTAITGGWSYPSTITATDAEIDALAGQSWATIGHEINLQIDHKDLGYREYAAGPSSTVYHWVKNFRTPNTGRRNAQFGGLTDGTPVDGDYNNNAASNWNGFYVGHKYDDFVNFGILFGRRVGEGSVMLSAPASYSLSGARPLAFLDTGDNPIILNNFTGSVFQNGMLWQNSGNFYARKGGISREILLNGERFFAGSITNQVNRLELYGGATGGAPALVVTGTDANISLELRTKGSGRVLIGSPYTAQAGLSIIGFYEVKDSSGVTRKTAVVG